MIEGGEQKISIKVEGKRYRIATLTADDFIVTPVLTDVTAAGEYTVQLNVQKKDINDSDFAVVSYPQTVKLSFDRVNSKEFDVEAAADGISAAVDYLKETPSANPVSYTHLFKIIKFVLSRQNVQTSFVRERAGSAAQAKQRSVCQIELLSGLKGRGRILT